MEKMKRFLLTSFLAIVLLLVLLVLYPIISFYRHFEVEYRESYDTYALVAVKNWDDEKLELPTHLPNGKPITILDASLSERNETVKELIIPDSYTMILHGVGDAFCNLEKITIGSNVSDIAGNFASSPQLHQIVVDQDNKYYLSQDNCVIDKRNNCLVMGCRSSKIPRIVTNIGQEAFACVLGLEELYIPPNVVFIDAAAFVMCQDLEKVTISSGVLEISKCAFYRCHNLTLHCDFTAKPHGWDDGWVAECKDVIWRTS